MRALGVTAFRLGLEFHWVTEIIASTLGISMSMSMSFSMLRGRLSQCGNCQRFHIMNGVDLQSCEGLASLEHLLGRRALLGIERPDVSTLRYFGELDAALARMPFVANAIDGFLRSRSIECMTLLQHRSPHAQRGAITTIGRSGNETRRQRGRFRQRPLTWIFIALCCWTAMPGLCWAEEPFIGDYEGTYQADQSQTTKATAKVIAEGPGYYRVVLQAAPLTPGEPAAQFEIYGVQQGTKVNLFGRANAAHWHGSIVGEKLAADPGYYGMGLELKKTVRRSPTEGAPPPSDAVVLLAFAPGQAPDTSAWKGGSWKPQGDGSLQCDPGKGSIMTKQNFGDMKLHVEFWLPLMADSFGQGRANSGVIINNLYEIQVLDSFGLVPSMGDCGAIYSQARPRVNASLPPERWQTYDINFRAPRMDPDGSVKEKARVTVELNGVKVQDDVPIEGATAGHEPGKPPANAATGPLQLQDHGNRVRYRNVWLVETKQGQQ